MLNSATEYAGGMISSVERDDSGSCQKANQGSRKSESRQLDSKGEWSGGCPEHRNTTGFADTPHMKSEEGYTQLREYLRVLYDETCKRLTSKKSQKSTCCSSAISGCLCRYGSRHREVHSISALHQNWNSISYQAAHA